MILLLGSTGYIGSQFIYEMNARGIQWVTVPHRSAITFLYGAKSVLLVINCAAYIPKESVSLCDSNQEETINGNVVLPSRLADLCQRKGIPFAHISTGCLWSDGLLHRENDPPQRAFNGHCGFYVGTKVLSEQVTKNCAKHYIWRVRLPFDNVDSERNYLSKLATFPEVWDHNNSVSHRGDFAAACLDLWELKAPWGTYNVMNTGSVRASDIVDMLVERGIRKDRPVIIGGKTGSSLVSVQKLLDSGVRIRSASEAIEESINRWVK